MDMGGLGGVFSSLAGAAIKGTAARAQRMEARKIMQKIGEMPPETLAPELLENKTNAQIAATQGLPSAQYNQSQRNIQRQQMQAIKTSQDRRSAGSLIPAIQMATNDANLNLDVANAKARMSNQAQLTGVNNNIGRMRKAIYDTYINKYYLPNLNYAKALNGAGYQNAIAGLDQGVSGIANFIGGSGGSGGGSSAGGSPMGG